MIKESRLDIAEVEVLPGNIILVTGSKGAEIDLFNAQRLIKHVNSLLDHSIPRHACIFDISQVTYINSDAREYFASAEDKLGTSVALAMLSTSFLGTTIGNLFRSLNNDSRKVPVRFFDSPIRAEHWVRTKMREAAAEAEQIAQVA